MIKKIVYVSLLFIMLLSMATPVFAADPTVSTTASTTTKVVACDDVLEGVVIDPQIPSLVHTIIVVIKIAVPVLLVIMGSIDLLKSVAAQKEDEIKKGQQIFIKRLIAGALVFFVITIVQFFISLVAGGDANETSNMSTCVNCFLNNKCGAGN